MFFFWCFSGTIRELNEPLKPQQVYAGLKLARPTRVGRTTAGPKRIFFHVWQVWRWEPPRGFHLRRVATKLLCDSIKRLLDGAKLVRRSERSTMVLWFMRDKVLRWWFLYRRADGLRRKGWAIKAIIWSQATFRAILRISHTRVFASDHLIRKKNPVFQRRWHHVMMNYDFLDGMSCFCLLWSAIGWLDVVALRTVLGVGQRQHGG